MLAAAMVSWLKVVKARQVSPTWSIKVALTQCRLASVAVARLAPKPPRLVRAARLLPLVALQRVPIARSIISRWTGAHFSGIQGTNA